MAILLLLQLEVATRLEQWEEFHSIWSLLEGSGILQESIEQQMAGGLRKADLLSPLGINEIRRAFKMLALVSLRTGDVEVLQRHLVDAVSPPTIDALHLILAPAVRHALLWSYYLQGKWQAGVSLRDLSVRLGCSAPSSASPRINDCTYSEMMLECLTRSARRQDTKSQRNHEQALEKLLSFSWTASSSSSSAGEAHPSDSSSAAAADKGELHSLYTALDGADADDAAADLADVAAALRQELCDITRKRLMTISWADRPDDTLCPVRVAVHAQAVREAAVAQAVLLGLPAPTFHTPPRPADRPLLQVTLHHYHSSAALAASIGLLLRCIAVLEPLHGIPDVQLHMAPWQAPVVPAAPALAAGAVTADEAAAQPASPLPSATSTAAAVQTLPISPSSPSLSPSASPSSSWWSSITSSTSSSDTSNRAAHRDVILTAQEAVSAWSSHALPTGSVFTAPEHASSMRELAHLWIYALGSDSGVDSSSLWKPAQPYVRLDASQLAKLQKRLTPVPPRPRTHLPPELTLKQALLAMQSPFSNLYDEQASRRQAAADGELSDGSGSKSLPAIDDSTPSESPSQRHYTLMREKIQLGEAQVLQAPTSTPEPIPRTPKGEME